MVYLILFSNSIYRVIRDYTKALFLITNFQGLSSSKSFGLAIL